LDETDQKESNSDRVKELEKEYSVSRTDEVLFKAPLPFWAADGLGPPSLYLMDMRKNMPIDIVVDFSGFKAVKKHIK
jgi:hypothetical protein